jgi:glycosyltransferase involved in cell wall biosynthesis
VLSYNWGSMDGVMARRLLSPLMRLPPLIHHEDGFNDDETLRQKPIRVRFRRAALGTAYALVVPSERLERIARRSWHQPAARVRRIANGVPVERFAAMPLAGSIPGFVRGSGDIVVGTIAGLRTVKNLPRLVRMLDQSGTQARLVIAGEGPARAAIEAEVARLGLGGRVLLAGHVADPASYIGHFDVFALSSDSEQFPLALAEAMAAGLPVVSTDVGDVCAMVSTPNRPYILPAQDEAGLAAALSRLVQSRDLRHRIGVANRARAVEAFREQAMIDSYRSLYEAAMQRPGALSRH